MHYGFYEHLGGVIMLTLKSMMPMLQHYRFMIGGSLLLIVTLSYLMVRMSVSSNLSPALTYEENKPAVVASTLLSQQDLQRLLSWNLFGQSVITVAPSKTLSFEITGIIQSTIPNKAGLLITTKGSEEKVYNAGDRLPNGDRFEKIDGDRIIMSREGKLRAVVFDQKTNNLSSSSDDSLDPSSYSSAYNSDSSSDADSNSDDDTSAEDSSDNAPIAPAENYSRKMRLHR